MSSNQVATTNSGDMDSTGLAELKETVRKIKIEFPKEFIDLQLRRIDTIKIQLFLEFPFFGFLLTNLRVVVCHQIPTMATDGIHLYVNPVFTDSFFVSNNFHSRNIEGILRKNGDVAEYLKHHAIARSAKDNFWTTKGFHYVAFILLHEISHCIRDHTQNGRQGKRSLMLSTKNGFPVSLYNIAGDYVINGDITNDLKALNQKTPSGKNISDFIAKPKMGLFDSKFDNMSTEEVYDILLKQLKDKPEGSNGNKKSTDMEKLGIDEGDMFDEHDNLPNQNEDGSVNNADGTVTSKSRISDMWEAKLGEAVIRNQEAGNIPLSAQRAFDVLFAPPKVEWYDELSKYISTSNIGDDINYRRPNKRYQEFFIPTYKSENIQLVVAMDTSGSMDTAILMKGASEVEGILTAFNNVTVRIMSCDMVIHGNELWDGVKSLSDDVVKLAEAFRGGGGTDFRPVFDAIEALDGEENYNILIFFTDGYGSFPEVEPDYDVIWIRQPNDLPAEQFPFGRVITIN